MDTVIEIKHLEKHFGDLRVLNDINFTIERGKVVTIIGSSGSGKSTLLRCINLLEVPDAGEILFNGQNILKGDLDASTHRSKVGMVFQNFNLFSNKTVLENCMIGQIKVLKKSKEEARIEAMKQLKAVGKTTFIPVCFAVNEPLLFATPIVLNPYFFIPFLLAPMVNVSLFKFFVDVLKMNSFIYVLPWATPAPIGLILGTGISFLAVLLAVLLIVVDGIIYLPFVKAYDASLLEEEKQKEALEALEEQVKEEEPETNEPLQLDKKINVLVLCVGAGTSAMFANAVKEGAKETGLPVDATASAYGNHYEILKNYDVVVLSPQVQAHLEEVKQDAKEGTKVIATKGAQYIQLTRDPKGAVEFIVEQEKEG